MTSFNVTSDDVVAAVLVGSPAAHDLAPAWFDEPEQHAFPRYYSERADRLDEVESGGIVPWDRIPPHQEWKDLDAWRG